MAERQEAPGALSELPVITTSALTATPPFSWRQTLLALAAWRAAPDRGALTADGEGWLVALRVAPGPRGLVVAEARGAEGGSGLSVTLRSADELAPAEVAGAGEQLTWRLALGLDTRPLLAAAAVDQPFAPVADALRGFHPPLFPSAFQAACWTVVRQRTPPAFAAASMERLVDYLGAATAVPGAPRLLRLFPAPADLGDDARPALLAATNNLRKVDRLRGLADAFAADEAWLRTASYDEAFRWLASLPGLGPWSAEQVAWRALGRYERVPWLDTGALQAIGDVYAGGLTPAKGSARELAERYGWSQGLWLRYLKAYPRAKAGAGAPARP